MKATSIRHLTVTNAWLNAQQVNTAPTVLLATGPAQTLQIVLQILLLARPTVIRFAQRASPKITNFHLMAKHAYFNAMLVNTSKPMESATDTANELRIVLQDI